MTRKHTRRKVYNTNPGFNPVMHAILGAAVTDTASLDKLRMRELQAIDAFAHGQATREDWQAVADMSNIAETMALMNIGREEVLPVVHAVEDALAEAVGRFNATGRIGTTGPGLQAMRDLYAYHDTQRTSVDRASYERAIARTANRLRSAHPGRRVVA